MTGPGRTEPLAAAAGSARRRGSPAGVRPFARARTRYRRTREKGGAQPRRPTARSSSAPGAGPGRRVDREIRPSAASPSPATNVQRYWCHTVFQTSCFVVADLMFRQAHHEVLTPSLSKGEERFIHSEIPYYAPTPAPVDCGGPCRPSQPETTPDAQGRPGDTSRHEKAPPKRGQFVVSKGHLIGSGGGNPSILAFAADRRLAMTTGALSASGAVHDRWLLGHAAAYTEHASLREKWQGASALPSSSNVNFLRNIQGIVYLNAQIPDGAFNLRMSKEKLNCSQISGSTIDECSLGSP